MSAEDTSRGTTAEAAAATSRRTVGRVVSNKMQKSVTVSVERLVRHPVYGKFIRRTTKVMAHDEHGSCREGDTVAIVECRPISKRKSWRVVEILKRAPQDVGSHVDAAAEAQG
ncbi:MAG TPA: 30S ribosomal protein S17 [Gammaproteobacteria bacterium]|nr:30S ribosomal protein S17 [Gammaproteobacteria bacterium]